MSHTHPYRDMANTSTEGRSQHDILRRRHVGRTVAPGGSPLGTHRGLTPSRATSTWGLTAPPGASHASRATLTPGPHVPTWGTTLGHLTAYRTACHHRKGA